MNTKQDKERCCYKHFHATIWSGSLLIVIVLCYVFFFQKGGTIDHILIVDQWEELGKEYTAFIENILPNYIKKGCYYVPSSESLLPLDIEYDPNTRAVYIHFSDAHGGWIGQGKCKRVTKSLLYHPQKPQIVARAVQFRSQPDEIKVLQKLPPSASGIYQVYSITERIVEGKKQNTIFAKWYRNGSLHELLEKGFCFTFDEKTKIAKNVLQGLLALHSRRIVHRDLGTRNYLAEIVEQPDGRRSIEVVIADLGRAIPIKKAKGVKAQGNFTYVAPEALLPGEMPRKGYYATDIYALGCVLYELYHGVKAPWRLLYPKRDLDLEVAQEQLKNVIRRYSDARREELAGLVAAGTAQKEERFEYLILKMCDVDPMKRGSARTLLNELLENVL